MYNEKVLIVKSDFLLEVQDNGIYLDDSCNASEQWPI